MVASSHHLAPGAAPPLTRHPGHMPPLLLPGSGPVYIAAARCTMVSERRTVTYIGQTNKDEMCNFYLMYYVDEGEPLEQKYCFSRGPPLFYWQSLLNSIPDKDASTLD
ncbi:hypothetical protein J6590_052922 [Homalodisca vitripennis]|nr:hypothetical protein J6590_052922 [Homalodisca vitripennis]